MAIEVTQIRLVPDTDDRHDRALVTFAQQAIIRRFVDEEKIRAILDENRKKIAAGAGKKSKFMSKLEEAMKASEETRRKAEEEKKKRKKK